MLTRIAAAVALVVATVGMAGAQYPTQYGQTYYPHGYGYKPYYPTYPYQYYCPPKAEEKKAEPQESVYDTLLKEAKLRKVISELPKDQQEIMLKRLGWWKEKEPGSVPPLSQAEIDLIKGLLNPKK